MQTLTYSYTRSHLLETIQRVVDDDPVFISRKGQTEAVLMSAQQFEQITSKQNSFATRLTDWRKISGNLMMADADFYTQRQQDTGREFSW